MLWSLVVSLFGIHLVLGSCPTTTWRYDNSFSTYTLDDAGGGATGAGFLMMSPEYLVPDACSCGVLNKWLFYAKTGGAIQFQVWERLDYNNYILRGENYFTIPNSAINTEIEFQVPVKDRITVKNNFYIGWFTLNRGKIGYKAGNPDENRIDTGIGDLSQGDTYDWNSGTSAEQLGKAYAIGATVTENTAPGFNNLPRTVQIYRTWTQGSFLYTVEADDIDDDDDSLLLISHVADPTGYFNFTVSSRTVGLAKSYPPAGSYPIQFTVSDQCGNSATATLTIVVLNWAPKLTNLPSFASVTENYDHEVELYTVTFSDADDTTLTQVVNKNPSTSNIMVKNTGHDSANLSIVTKRGSSYSYSTTQFFLIDITLNDGTYNTDTGYFMVYVTKNDPPKIHNLNHAATVNVSYITTAIGDVVYSVNVTDAENDPLTFTMVCDPAGCPFVISSDGVISATADLIRTYTTGYDIVVTVTDGTTTVQSMTLTVLVQDINDQPQINNLPLNNHLLVFENTALDTLVFTVGYNDLDSDDTIVFEATYNPAWGANYFQINSTSGEITTSTNVIDFEKVLSYDIILTITVSDGQHWDTETLTIRIANVNEAPSFHQTKYTLEPQEEGTAGLSAGNPNMIVDDADLLVSSLNEVHYYTWDCGIYSRYFIMSYTTSDITFSTTFDYDTANVTVPYSCTVTVTDKGGLTATTVLEIDIHDVNDNSPVFTQTNDYLIFQIPDLALSRFVGQVRATDNDRSAYFSAIYYSIISTTPTLSNGYLYINPYGNIYVNETWSRPEFDYGVSYLLVIRAENVQDSSGLKRSATATATLVISGTTTVSTTTTDRTAYFIKDDTRNVAWVAVASALVVALLCLACCMMLNYTVQTKRFRWAVPWIRKRLLGLRSKTQKVNREYYLKILLEEELGRSSSDSDADDWLDVDDDDDDNDQPVNWTQINFNKKDVPEAASYYEPMPPKKISTTGV